MPGRLQVVDRIERLSDAPPDRWVLCDQIGCVVRRVDDRRYKAVKPLLYTHAVIWGYVDDAYGFEDRWCFATAQAALLAAEVWAGPDGPEPVGWHRHPRSGRRRPDGDASREFVDP